VTPTRTRSGREKPHTTLRVPRRHWPAAFTDLTTSGTPFTTSWCYVQLFASGWVDVTTTSARQQILQRYGARSPPDHQPAPWPPARPYRHAGVRVWRAATHQGDPTLDALPDLEDDEP
jgi:hypothetical protein